VGIAGRVPAAGPSLMQLLPPSRPSRPRLSFTPQVGSDGESGVVEGALVMADGSFVSFHFQRPGLVAGKDRLLE
jgi:hypothetical protein